MQTRRRGTSQTVMTFTSVSKTPSRLQQHTQTILGSLLKTIHPEMHRVKIFFRLERTRGRWKNLNSQGLVTAARKTR